ncbi:MAG: hypothetical protein USCAAHI_03060 [Beijerinckiaceae bacterium]|nr:MAG: hypothetical protein USCAAHI_03060 [Beijerinckiaceae bacterium]
MKKPGSVARRLSQASGQEKPVKPIEITDIVDGAQCTAPISPNDGRTRKPRQWAPIASLAGLLARAQLEPELWSRQSQ